MKLLPLLILGGVGFALYKASTAQAQAAPPAPPSGTTGGSSVSLPGITIPPRVHLTRTDILVARALINQRVRYIMPDGKTSVKAPTGPRYLDAGNLTPADRLSALQQAINLIDYDLRYGDAPQASLFETLMGGGAS